MPYRARRLRVPERLTAYHPESRSLRKEKRKAVARAAEYRRYSFSQAGTYYWGIYLNGVPHVYGSVEWQRSGNFNGRQGQFWQSGDVLEGPTVRYDFRIEKYRSTASGWEYREVQRDIVPDYPNCTSGRARQPTWKTYHSTGFDFYESYWFKLPDCAHTNPQTADGTWYSVRQNSKPYHCVDSLGSCYFKGY